MSTDDPLNGATVKAAPLAVTKRRAAKDYQRQCKHVIRFGDDSRRCEFPPLTDAEFCARHLTPGRPTIDIMRFREQMIDGARYELLRMSPQATHTLEALVADEKTPANVRLKAATEILDRIGVRGGTEVDVRAEVAATPSDEIMERLASMGANFALTTAIHPSDSSPSDDNIVDSEVVDD